MRFRDKDKECAKQMIIFHQNHLKAAAVLLAMQPEMGFFFIYFFYTLFLQRAKSANKGKKNESLQILLRITYFYNA